MFFKAFEIERRSFSTDYMEWNLRSSARLRSAMIVNESDEARPRHRDEQPDQDPGHRRPLLGHGEADSWLVRQRTGRPLEESTQQRKQRRAGRAANGTKQVSVCLRLSLHRARSGSRRRGRSQGGASRAQQKSSSARSASTRRRARLEGGAVQLDSERGWPLEESTQQRRQRRAGEPANGAGPHRSQGQPDVK